MRRPRISPSQRLSEQHPLSAQLSQNCQGAKQKFLDAREKKLSTRVLDVERNDVDDNLVIWVHYSGQCTISGQKGKIRKYFPQQGSLSDNLDDDNLDDNNLDDNNLDYNILDDNNLDDDNLDDNFNLDDDENILFLVEHSQSTALSPSWLIE